MFTRLAPARGRGFPRHRELAGKDEFLGAGAVEFGEEGRVDAAGRPVEHDAPGIHRDDAVEIGGGVVHLVQRDDQRDAVVAAHRHQRVHHPLGRLRIERGDGLVGQHQLGALHQRAGDGDALLLAAGQLARLLAGMRLDADLGERGKRGAALIIVPEAERAAEGIDAAERADQHIGHHAEPADQGELLEHQADMAAGAAHLARQPPAILHADAEGGDLARALVGKREAGGDADEGGLAGAGSADQRHALALPDRERDIVHGTHGAVGLAHAVEFERSRHAGVPRRPR